jgi:hypothetical protein
LRRTTSTRDAVRCSSAVARAAGAERSAWTSGAGSTYAHGSPHAPRCLSGRCSASSTAPPAGDPGQAPRSAPSSAGSPLRRGLGVAPGRTSCATPTPSSWPARASRSTSSSANSGTQPRHDLHLPARNRPRGDHRRRPRPTRADDVGQRRAATLSYRIARRERPSAPAPDASRPLRLDPQRSRTRPNRHVNHTGPDSRSRRSEIHNLNRWRASGPLEDPRRPAISPRRSPGLIGNGLAVTEAEDRRRAGEQRGRAHDRSDDRRATSRPDRCRGLRAAAMVPLETDRNDPVSARSALFIARIKA